MILLNDNIEGCLALVHYMNRIEAKQIASSVMNLFTQKDVSNFEKLYAEDMVCHLNSEKLDLEDLRIRVAYIIDHFDVLEMKLKDMVYEKDKAAFHFFIKIKRLEDQKEFEDDVLYFYHFEKNQIKESWTIFKLPLNYSPPDIGT